LVARLAGQEARLAGQIAKLVGKVSRLAGHVIRPTGRESELIKQEAGKADRKQHWAATLAGYVTTSLAESKSS
jgi:hypothetical protein